MNPLPVIGIIIRILILALKRRGFINQGSTLGFMLRPSDSRLSPEWARPSARHGLGVHRGRFEHIPKGARTQIIGF